MGIIRRESSAVTIESPKNKERQISVETTDIPYEAHEGVGHYESSSAPSPTISHLSRSPLPPLSHGSSLESQVDEARDREARLSMSLDSSLATLAREHETRPHSAGEAARRTLSLDEMRTVLMDHKQRVINRLESMGYDPYKGVYVKHRKWLMNEKEKAVHRLEELGIDPLTGTKKAKRV